MPVFCHNKTIPFPGKVPLKGSVPGKIFPGQSGRHMPCKSLSLEDFNTGKTPRWPDANSFAPVIIDSFLMQNFHLRWPSEEGRGQGGAFAQGATQDIRGVKIWQKNIYFVPESKFLQK